MISGRPISVHNVTNSAAVIVYDSTVIDHGSLLDVTSIISYNIQILKKSTPQTKISIKRSSKYLILFRNLFKHVIYVNRIISKISSLSNVQTQLLCQGAQDLKASRYRRDIVFYEHFRSSQT